MSTRQQRLEHLQILRTVHVPHEALRGGSSLVQAPGAEFLVDGCGCKGNFVQDPYVDGVERGCRGRWVCGERGGGGQDGVVLQKLGGVVPWQSVTKSQ